MCFGFYQRKSMAQIERICIKFIYLNVLCIFAAKIKVIWKKQTKISIALRLFLQRRTYKTNGWQRPSYGFQMGNQLHAAKPGHAD